MPSVSNCSAMEDCSQLTEKDFLVSMVRELSRVYIGKTNGQENIWNKGPSEWNLKELGNWKNPTSTPKDPKPLLIKKLNFLRERVRTDMLSDAQKDKLELFAQKKIKDALQYMQIEKHIKHLEVGRHYLSDWDRHSSEILQRKKEEWKCKVETTLKEMNKFLSHSNQDVMPTSATHCVSSKRKRKRDGPDPVTPQIEYRNTKQTKYSKPRPIFPKPSLSPISNTTCIWSNSGIANSSKIRKTMSNEFSGTLQSEVNINSYGQAARETSNFDLLSMEAKIPATSFSSGSSNVSNQDTTEARGLTSTASFSSDDQDSVTSERISPFENNNQSKNNPLVESYSMVKNMFHDMKFYNSFMNIESPDNRVKAQVPPDASHFQEPASISSTFGDSDSETYEPLVFSSPEMLSIHEDSKHNEKIMSCCRNTYKPFGSISENPDIREELQSSPVLTQKRDSVDSGAQLTDDDMMDESCNPVAERLNNSEDNDHRIVSAIVENTETYLDKDCVLNPEEYLKENEAKLEVDYLLEILGLQN